MTSFLETLMLLALLMAASQLGLWLQTRLHERHFTRDSVESVRLGGDDPGDVHRDRAWLAVDRNQEQL